MSCPDCEQWSVMAEPGRSGIEKRLIGWALESSRGELPMWSLVCAPFLHFQGISFGPESQLLPNLCVLWEFADSGSGSCRMDTRCLVREQEWTAEQLPCLSTAELLLETQNGLRCNQGCNFSCNTGRSCFPFTRLNLVFHRACISRGKTRNL